MYLSWSWATCWPVPGLTYPEISSKVCHDSFCQSGSSVSLPWVIYCEPFYLHVVSIFSCIPVICPKLVLFLTPLKFVCLFCNLSECILLFFLYQRLKVTIVPLELPCSGPVNHSGEILTTGKSHRKKPDIFSFYTTTWMWKVCQMYEGNSISKLQIQVATYVFELNAGNCHR